MQALVIGGTGPTEYFIVNGLLQRGYDVTILHRGTHEVPEIPPEVEHVHADPHFKETLIQALAGRVFDVVIATYGRLRLVAEVLIGKTPRFLGVTGIVPYQGYVNPSAKVPNGMQLLAREDSPLVESEEEARFAYLIASTEEVVMQHHRDRQYDATLFRYPSVYGPYQPIPREWSVIRRILDKRPYIILPDGGLTLFTRGFAANLAHAVLLAVDQPEAASGQIYNCGDEHLFSLHQWVELITKTMEYDWEIICLPDSVAHPSRAMIPFRGSSHHRVVDLYKIQTELGYKDTIPAKDALAATVCWYLEHPPERDGDLEKGLLDPFDYGAEDALVSAYRESMQRMARIHFDLGHTYHQYAHPKLPGQQRDHRRR